MTRLQARPFPGFHPLWAGLSFQSRVGPSRSKWRRSSSVSIPFGRVSVFKVAFDGLSNFAEHVVSIPFGRVSVFKGCKMRDALTILWMFPSPLGGSQFSKGNNALARHPRFSVSIPFGRVSVFKVTFI